MARNSESVPASTGTRRPWDALDPDPFYGLVAVLVGLGQLPVALAFPPGRLLPTFVVASGGMLLVTIGTSLFRGRAPFESGWTEDGEPGWVSAMVQAALALAVVVASVLAVVS